ncbi:MAG: hypothetical protein AB7T27_08835 [Kiritimatiellia bacterium]
MSGRDLGYLDGTRFCIVLMRVLNQAAREVQLTPIYGTARVSSGELRVEEPSGSGHTVPESALSSIHPSDGNEILKDAEHYVIVKIAELR